MRGICDCRNFLNLYSVSRLLLSYVLPQVSAHKFRKKNFYKVGYKVARLLVNAKKSI